MKPLDLEFDPYANDEGRFGVSLVNAAELMIPCLDAAGAKSVVEVGAYAGDLTALLLRWAARAGARVVAIDPSPQPGLAQLDETDDALELVRETSLDALQHIELPDAAIIDGDHNYWTVSEELRLIGERAEGAALPLLLFHDVAWPHARRDDYYSPELIPEEYRQPTQPGGGLVPHDPGTRDGGVPYRWPAAREGGPRNGVLTAVEDFVASREGLRLAVVPVFFGFGIAWHVDAPYAGALEEILAPWDRNPLLERLETNRVGLLTKMIFEEGRRGMAEERRERKDRVLLKVLESRTFAVAVAISRIYGRGRPEISRADLRSALDQR
jgi:SAM-dependent methyltransferase